MKEPPRRPPETTNAVGSEWRDLPATTFQGRRIVTIAYEGREREVVEGLWAFRQRESHVERALSAPLGTIVPPDRLGIGIMNLPPVENDRALEALNAFSRDLEWYEPLFLDHIVMQPNDPQYHDQWGLRAIDAEAAWDQWRGSPNGVLLAILDSGIPIDEGGLSHPDLREQSRFILGKDFVNGRAEPRDDNGHGTHVTGIAAATSNNAEGIAGLSWEGRVMVNKVFDQNGNASSSTFEQGLVAAVDYARVHNLKLVVNYSGGGGPSRAKEEAVIDAVTRGSLVVAAAGNGSGNPVLWPGAYATKHANIICVGATDQRNQRWSGASRGPEISVAAPGFDILSTIPNYRVASTSSGAGNYARKSGTSMATPFVAALATLVWSLHQDWPAELVKRVILETADPGTASPDDVGKGIINAARALAWVRT